MDIDLDEVEELINEHAWLNPHASFWLNDDNSWEATQRVTKWTPRSADPGALV